MTERKKIPVEEYSIVISNPATRLSVVCVNIYKDGGFHMNGKLAEKLGGKKINIRFTKDAKHLMMIENNDDNAISFPKAGCKKLEEVGKMLTSHKIAFPAQYEVWYDADDGFWRGELAENPTIPRQGKRDILFPTVRWRSARASMFGYGMLTRSIRWAAVCSRTMQFTSIFTKCQSNRGIVCYDSKLNWARI